MSIETRSIEIGFDAEGVERPIKVYVLGEDDASVENLLRLLDRSPKRAKLEVVTSRSSHQPSVDVIAELDRSIVMLASSDGRLLEPSIRSIRERRPKGWLIVVVESGGASDARKAIDAGANDFISLAEESSASIFRAAVYARQMNETRAKSEQMIRHLENVNRSLDKLAMFDGLTEVANRRYFDKTIDAEWRRSQRNRSPLSLLIFDIDCFKAYNDRFGHVRGDDVLKRVANAIAEGAHRGGDFTARYGGEEFAVLLPGTDVRERASVGETIRKAVADLRIPHPSSTVEDRIVTVSGGGSSIVVDESTSCSDFINRVDRLLYQAKRDGRNRIVLDAPTKST
jgi:diguanylate cyclase (GGDEF)-like protein